MDKIKYLDGLRGVAALIVVFNHFCTGFYPATYFSHATSHITNNFDTYVSGSFISIVLNGDFAVCLFFVLSGYVLSYKYFQTKDKKVIIGSASKRYLRLSLPIFASTMLYYIFLYLNLFYSKEASSLTSSSWLSDFYNFEPSFFHALYQSFIGAFSDISGTNVQNYNRVLWTMSYELYGSFFVFFFLWFFGNTTWHTKRNAYAFFILLLSIMAFIKAMFLGFILGILLSEFTQSSSAAKLTQSRYFRTILVFTLLIAVYLSSIPFGRVPLASYYQPIILLHLQNNISFLHTIGGALLIFSIIYTKRLQVILSHRYVLFLGKISFPLYLTHLLILTSFTSFVFVHLYDFMTYNYAFLASFVLSLPLMFILAYYFETYVDQKTLKFCNSVYKKYIEPRIIPLLNLK